MPRIETTKTLTKANLGLAAYFDPIKEIESATVAKAVGLSEKFMPRLIMPYHNCIVLFTHGHDSIFKISPNPLDFCGRCQIPNLIGECNIASKAERVIRRKSRMLQR